MKITYVAVLHEVLLSFRAFQTFFLQRFFAAERVDIFVFVHVRFDESLGDVGMNLSRGQHRIAAGRHGPGMHLLRSGG